MIGRIGGSCRSVAPPSILQITDDFRRRPHLYRGLKFLAVDESRPTMGIEEGVFMLFVSGEELGHIEMGGAETHFAARSKCGKSWRMRPDDVPRVPIAAISA